MCVCVGGLLIWGLEYMAACFWAGERKGGIPTVTPRGRGRIWKALNTARLLLFGGLGWRPAPSPQLTEGLRQGGTGAGSRAHLFVALSGPGAWILEALLAGSGLHPLCGWRSQDIRAPWRLGRTAW